MPCAHSFHVGCRNVSTAQYWCWFYWSFIIIVWQTTCKHKQTFVSLCYAVIMFYWRLQVNFSLLFEKGETFSIINFRAFNSRNTNSGWHQANMKWRKSFDMSLIEIIEILIKENLCSISKFYVIDTYFMYLWKSKTVNYFRTLTKGFKSSEWLWNIDHERQLSNCSHIQL